MGQTSTGGTNVEIILLIGGDKCTPLSTLVSSFSSIDFISPSRLKKSDSSKMKLEPQTKEKIYKDRISKSIAGFAQILSKQAGNNCFYVVINIQKLPFPF